MQKRRYCRQFISTFLLMVIAFSSPLIQAGVVELSQFGETNTAAYGNDFGLAVGDMASLKSVFDHTRLNGFGNEVTRFSDSTNKQISLFMGDLTFTESNHLDFNLGYPLLHFFDGSFSGLDYLGFSELSGSPAIAFSSAIQCCDKTFKWLGVGGSQYPTGGSWGSEKQKIADIPNIPEPAPLFLAGIGLLGAWISSRRKKKVFNI